VSAIAGIIQFDGRPVDTATIERMQTLLTPYGKDTQQHVHQGSAAFLRTLLRTTPEDSFDRQPLVHAESGTTLLFDGRIDNRDELAAALSLSATETRFMADSELVLRACLRWDTGAVERLLGDFALAYWQARRRRLILARDALGYRPLFWHRQEGFFAFATMPKALFAVPGVPRALREAGVHDYLTLIPMMGQETLFEDIYRVEPGQMVVVEEGRTLAEYHHRFDPDRRVKLGSTEEYVEALWEQLDRAVSCRLRAVGPVASELSSGMDSSTVTAAAARLLGDRNQRLLALTAVPREGFDGPVPAGRHADEGPGAAALASRYENIDHVLVRSSGRSPVDGLREVVAALDRPPLNICNGVWVRAMHEVAAKRGCRVVLNGWLGNMTLSYDGSCYLTQLLGQGRVLRWWHEVQAIRRRRPRLGLLWFVKNSVAPFVPARIWHAYEMRRDRGYLLEHYSAVNPELSRKLDTPARARRAGIDLLYRGGRNGVLHRINALYLVDFGEYSAAQNAAGFEGRSPLVDRRLSEFCLAIPEELFLKDGQPQWILRQMVKEVLPAEILDRGTRGLQSADWFEATGAALPEILTDVESMREHATAKRYVDVEAMRTTVIDWPSGGWGRQAVEQRFRLKLLRGVSVGSFIRYVEDDNR
jgi:asparagine synthase (glutamine-hydrolysing)